MNNDLIDQIYNEILQKLKNGQRPLRLYPKNEGTLLLSKLEILSRATEINEEELEKILCLLEHGQCHGVDFTDTLTLILSRNLNKNSTLFCLSVSIKWIVEYQGRIGFPIPNNFKSLLAEKLIAEEDFEIIEWILRVIESMGRQGLFYKNILLEKKSYIKPKLFRKTSTHQQNCYEIFLMLESRWP